MEEKESTPGCCIIGAIFTAFLGLMAAPMCWILKDGLLNAYPSHGLGGLAHFFRSFLWGLWPVATLVLLILDARSRMVRYVCLGLPGICIFIFLIPQGYAKAYISYTDSPFTTSAPITLWQQGAGRIHHWTGGTNTPETDKIWQDWEIAHNSTHCWRCHPGSIEHPLARCELHYATITWDDEDAEITNRADTFTRPRNEQDARLLHHLQRTLNKKAGD